MSLVFLKAEPLSWLHYSFPYKCSLYFMCCLGEEPWSFGYGGTGKFSTNCRFSDYGQRFGAGDVVGAMLDLDSRPASISFTKNGTWFGVACPLHGFPVGSKDMALFPHLLLKNSRSVITWECLTISAFLSDEAAQSLMNVVKLARIHQKQVLAERGLTREISLSVSIRWTMTSNTCTGQFSFLASQVKQIQIRAKKKYNF